MLGFGAAALVDTGEGSQVLSSAGNAAFPLLAQAVRGRGGDPRRVDHAGVDRRGGLRHHPGRGRRAHPHLGFLGLAIPAQRLNIAFLVALAFAVAASANQDTSNQDRYNELDVRSLTGAGAEKALVH
jgi:cation/acetate symporter